MVKNIIYKHLDKLFPINNNIVDASIFNGSQYDIMNFIFGLPSHYFFDWAIDRIGQKYGVKDASGDLVFYKKYSLHRDNNKPAIILENGAKYYFKNGKEYYI